MKASDNDFEWVKFGVIDGLSFIGKDVVCYGVGNVITFINLLTEKRDHYYVISHDQTGEGVRYLVGHRQLNFFAFVENCAYPHIYVVSYPEFIRVTTLKGAHAEGYIGLTFSESSMLITLSDIPQPKLTIWNWRRSEKVAEKETNVYHRRQILRCSLSKPVYLAQLACETNILHVWDIFMCCKKCIVTEHIVKIPTEKPYPYTGMKWTSEGGLFVIDTSGCIYVMNAEMGLEKVIESPCEGNLPTSITWYRAGLVSCGPDNMIRHYKKSGTWSCDWTMTPTNSMKRITSSRADILIGISMNEQLFTWDDDGNMKSLSEHRAAFNKICLVYPLGEYFIALSENKFLNLFEVISGNKITEKELVGKALTATENPEFPYIAIGYDHGLLELISAFNPHKLTVLTSFYLCTNPLNSVQFAEHGRIIVAACLDIGLFFILEGIPGGQIQVVTSVDVERQIIHYMLVAAKACYRLFVIPVTSPQYLCGNKFIRYCIVNENIVNVKEYEPEDPNKYYYRIYATNKVNRDRIFYALCFTSKHLFEMETKRGDSCARVISVINTGHQTRSIEMSLTKDYAITYAFDGLVIVRDTEFRDILNLAIPHNRRAGGVENAYLDPLGKYIITKGRSGLVACTNLKLVKVSEEKRQRLKDLVSSPKFTLLFRRQTRGFNPEGYGNITWLDYRAIIKEEEESKQCALEKAKILKELKDIRKSLKKLITSNLQGPENERIDLLEFNLNVNLYAQKKQKNKEECKDTEIYLKQLIIAQDKVTNWIKQKCYEPMEVREKTLAAIYAHHEATSYTILPTNYEKEEHLKQILEYRKHEKVINEVCSFHPWIRRPEEDLMQFLEPPSGLPPFDAAMKLIGDDTITTEDADTKLAFEGTLTSLFVDKFPYHYGQRELATYFQCELQQSFAEMEGSKLKQTHNKHFNDLFELKVREMNNIKEKYARLRHIISEINYFSKQKISVDVIDPEWRMEECPDSVFTAKDDELTVTPYISPSQQAMLDAKAAEEERIRLLLLADDFKERALMKMMNGVLEIRWEDELKKDVPLPACMINKQPEQYNEEDLRNVRDYEEAVKFLNSERERYKNLLFGEYNRICGQVRESVRKFNMKLQGILRLKLKIDAAMNQENLKVNRQRCREKAVVDSCREEAELLKLISNNESVIESLHRLVTSLTEDIKDCKTHIENVQAKDKILERAFKRDIQEASPVIQELAQKLYKRRPKVSFRAMNTPTVLNELAKSIATQERCLTLTQDCNDYLKAIEVLDTFSGLPPNIDEHTFQIICRHRRARIEFEVKVRAAYLDLAEAETTISTISKRLSHKKELNAQYASQLEQIRSDRLVMKHNAEIQLVLRRGIVEIPLSGEITDFHDAVLIRRREVTDINEKILEAGNKKLETMHHNMAFRRVIISTEWEHRRLRMRINDLIEQIKDVDDVKLTKEMQLYLKSKARGIKPERAMSFETDLELIAASYENTIKERKEKVVKLHKQTKAMKSSNSELDKTIIHINLDICQYKLLFEPNLEENKKKLIRSR